MTRIWFRITRILLVFIPAPFRNRAAYQFIPLKDKVSGAGGGLSLEPLCVSLGVAGFRAFWGVLGVELWASGSFFVFRGLPHVFGRWG